MTQDASPGGCASRVPVYLGLGSNLGDRAAHLAFGLRQLRALGRLTGVSSVYESDPVGYKSQPPFLNLVARLETHSEPLDLLAAALDIERQRGRRRTFKNAPRTLDIDILLWGGALIDEPGLKVPHPRLMDRAFALVPLLEIGGDLTDPRTGRPLASFRESLPDLELRRVMDGHELLEEENA